MERAIAGAQQKPKLIYVVSQFHNPKGTTLSLERRHQLIEVSRRHAVPVLEDDPYGELRYTGAQLPPLAALDRDGLVVYLSTFSKTLSPGMRVGWVHASDEIIQALVRAKQAADLHTNTIQQRAAARLLETFDFDGHVEHIRQVYGERCAVMLECVGKYFPEGARPTRPEGGLFLWIELPERVRAEELFDEALRERVAFVPGAPFFAATRGTTSCASILEQHAGEDRGGHPPSRQVFKMVDSMDECTLLTRDGGARSAHSLATARGLR